MTCAHHPLGCTSRCPHAPPVVVSRAPEPYVRNGLVGVVLRLVGRTS